jgi:hypothetical protein
MRVTMDLTDQYVAWCRYRPGVFAQLVIETCSSDDQGAFKVFRENVIEEAYRAGRLAAEAEIEALRAQLMLQQKPQPPRNPNAIIYTD